MHSGIGHITEPYHSGYLANIIYIKHSYTLKPVIRASVDALCRDGAGLISRERVQRGRLTRQGTRS